MLLKTHHLATLVMQSKNKHATQTKQKKYASCFPSSWHAMHTHTHLVIVLFQELGTEDFVSGQEILW